MQRVATALLVSGAVATHYEDPKNGCGSDEQAIKVQGVSGDFCSPKCQGTTCPTDAPSASDAKAQCALKSPTGDQFCALLCTPGSNAACPEGATCQPIQGVGLCTYPSAGIKTEVHQLTPPVTAVPRAPCAIPRSKAQINDPAFADCLNSLNGASWVAGTNKFFEGMTYDDARPLMGTLVDDSSEQMETLPALNITGVPDEFDARTNWKGLIHPIRNQAHCGSCWAFSASEVMSDRVAIATKKASPVLSPEDMVSCDHGDMGCRGGFLPRAWEYIKDTGLLTDSCFPYGAGGGNAPTCATKCADGSPFTRTKAKSVGAINGVDAMQKEIMTNGPIQVAFKVYKSFMSYKTGVYSKLPSETQPLGGHAVKIVGWGTEKGTDYWLVANSWDTTWGDEGFFKIKRGSNEFQIETMGPPYAGLASATTTVVV